MFQIIEPVAYDYVLQIEADLKSEPEAAWDKRRRYTGDEEDKNPQRKKRNLTVITGQERRYGA